MDYLILANKFNIPEEFIKKVEVNIKKFSPTYNSRYLDQVLECFLKVDLFNKKCKDYYSRVNFVTPFDCKFINLKQVYEKRGTWSFGCHWKDKNHVLMGYLQVLSSIGVIMLVDQFYGMGCVIVSNTTHNLSSYIDKCVVIKNYIVFTEKYNEQNTMNSEYLYFKTSDIEILENEHLGPPRLHEKTNQIANTNKTFRCRIIRKSCVCISQWGTPEIWFQIEIITLNQPPRSELFCLGPDSIKAGMFLERGKAYIFFSSKLREIYTNYEIQRCIPNVPSWKIDDPLFSARTINPSTLPPIKDVILTVGEAITNLTTKSHGSVISFKGKLHCKKLVKPLSSRTTSRGVHGFGTPGKDTHVLEFKSRRGDTLTLYLNNWERIQIPLGLIPEMEILVRDVEVQSSRYYKSTAFTSFQVVDYCPRVAFNTVDLYTETETETKLRKTDKFTHIGYGDRLPPYIVFWSRLSYIKIRSLKFFTSCLNCLSRRCRCRKNEPEITVTLTCTVMDGFGEGLLIANDLELLRLIFNISRGIWKRWCNAMKKLGRFVYTKGFYPDETGFRSRDAFAKKLFQTITTANLSPIKPDPIDVKCRKMEKQNNSRYGNVPRFYCLEAKSSLLK